MAVYDPGVDAYIERAAGFAKPLLEHLRELIHRHCPDVAETLKWGCPHFTYRGKNVFSMAAFKQHCTFGFSLAAVMPDPAGILQTEHKSAMGSLGRITTFKDLPTDSVLARYLKQSLTLVEEGVTLPRKSKSPIPEPEVPDYFLKVLKQHKKALAVFEAFSSSHRKEYLEWITEARKEETRNRRMAQAIALLEEGKPRHWKYER